MEEHILKWLNDVRDAIIEIEDIMGEYPTEYRSFEEDQSLQDSLNRNLVKIEEAVSNILHPDESFPAEPGKQLKKLNDEIQHEYKKIENIDSWNEFLNLIPDFKANISDIIHEVG